MADRPARSLVLPAALLASLAAPAIARAELPTPADFEVDYYITDEAGEYARPMSEADHKQLLNRARCQCGHQVGVRVKLTDPLKDTSTRFDAFIGTQCASAETTLDGQFRRCGRLAAELAVNYQAGVDAVFHPAFLAHGVEPGLSRDISDPGTEIAPACDAALEGESGLWMCKPTENSIANCQTDEFFLAPGELATLVGIPSLAYDFQPPILPVDNVSVEPGNGAVELTWAAAAEGDIHGFRVLCERADDGSHPGLDFPAPDLTAVPDGTHYFTAGNLCGGEPFSDVNFTSGGSDANTCGNGVVDPDEACDDGSGNDDDGLCDSACNLRVGPGLHALDWAHVCSDHIPASDRSVVIDGLENGVAYNFVLVPYDRFGNPQTPTRFVTATPAGDLPELGGEGCSCNADSGSSGLLALPLGALLALVRRRRR